MDDSIWDELDSLKMTLPETGTGPPDIEMVPQQEEEVKGLLWEITTKIYVWSDMENHKYQLTSSQNMTALGELTLEEAKQRMQGKRRRKGG